LTGDKPTRTTYFIRTEPRQSDAVFTSASKTARIRVTGELKTPQYKVKSGGRYAPSTIKIKAHTYVSINNAPGKLYSVKTTVEFARDARAEVWQAATAKKPASAKQVVGK